MKQNQHTEDADEMREEYDFAAMQGGVRGKYASKFDENTVAVVLDADVAEMFPDSQAVNEALRTLARVLRDKEGIPQTAVDTTEPHR